MKTQWKEEKIIGNKDEAIEQAIEEMKWAHQNAHGHAKDAIECALNRLGVTQMSEEEISEQKRLLYIAMTF